MGKDNNTPTDENNAAVNALDSTLEQPVPAPRAAASNAQVSTDKPEPEPVSEGYPADPEFQLRGGFANLMLDAASPLFGLVIRLRTLDELPNIQDVHQQVRSQIDNIQEEMRQHGYEPAQFAGVLLRSVPVHRRGRYGAALGQEQLLEPGAAA